MLRIKYLNNVKEDENFVDCFKLIALFYDEWCGIVSV